MEQIGFPLTDGDQGDAVARLHAALDALMTAQELTLSAREMAALQRILADERSRTHYGKATSTLVRLFQKLNGLDSAAGVDAATAAALNARLVALGLLTPMTGGFAVGGRVIGPVAVDMAALVVELVDKGIGGDAVLAQAAPSPGGIWQAQIDPSLLAKRGKARPDLQARVLSGKTVLGLSPVVYDAEPGSRLDVTITAASQADRSSEHAALIRDLSRLSQVPLAEMQEGEAAQDITWLARKSGWDARAIALAVLAERLYRQLDAVSPALFYALLRAGLPTAMNALLRSDPAQFREVWKQAAAAGVISAADLKRAKPALAALAQAAAAQALDGDAGLRGLLPESVSQGDDPSRYAMLAVEYGRDPKALRRALLDTFGPDRLADIESAGRLTALTGRNAGLVQRLVKQLGPAPETSPMLLVKAGLDRAEGWAGLIGDEVPDFVTGPTPEARRTAYAGALAAQVRLAYPAASLSRLLDEGEITPADDAQRGPAAAFLAEHAADFDPGEQPVAAYLRDRKIKLAPETAAEISRLQRVWQITPDTPAMSVLLNAGIGSAAETLRLSRDEFLTRFDKDLGAATAARIYDKAAEVHATVLNLALAYRNERAMPQITMGGSASNGTAMAPRVLIGGGGNTQDVLAYGTLEDLFGELDFCGCDHCRSVLSPAAYLVDLLQFLDRPAAVLPAGTTNPLDVLLDRRPDIQHLPLTCENTSTPLPYIDLVLEALEHIVANDLSLAGFQGFTTDPEVPPDQLLASPQNRRDTAYQRLAEASYPPPLPFHRPLEEMRLLLNALGNPLAETMADLRAAPGADRGAHPFGGTDLAIEQLGLSRAEFAALTQSQQTGGSRDARATVAALFGQPATSTEAELRARLTNARAFARAAAISHDDLVRLLRTRFINPDAVLLPRLERLGISLADIAALAAGGPAPTYAAGVDPADYGGNIGQWLTEPARLARIMGLVTLTATGAGAECDPTALELRHADPDPTRGRLRLSTLVALARFIRLWRKLGWSIEDTDAALTALWPAQTGAAPATEPTRLAALDAGFVQALPRLAELLSAGALLKGRLPGDLPSLLSLVAPMPALGRQSLYAQLFLNRPDLAPAFRRDQNGAVLTDPAARLLDRLGDLQAALALRDTDLAALIAALGYGGATPLDLDHVSALYRHGWLARKLRLSVPELLDWIAASGLDPFAPPDPDAPALTRLIRLIAALRDAGLPPARALALIWNRTGNPAPTGTEAQILTLARDLRTALAEADAAQTLPEVPDMAAARDRLGRAFPADIADRIGAMLDGSLLIGAAYDHDQPDLPAAIRAAGHGRLHYDDFGKRLEFAGALPAPVAAALKAVPGVSAGFRAAIDNLSTASAAAVGPLFADWPGLQSAYDSFVTDPAPEAQRLRAFLSALAPNLALAARRRAALAVAAANAKAEPALAEALLDDRTALHAADDTARPGIDDLLALAEPGLTAQFLAGGAVFAEAAAVLPDFGPGATTLPKPAGAAPSDTITVTLTGWLLGAGDGPVQIALRGDPGAAVTLMLDGAPVVMADDGQGLFTNADPVVLSAQHPAAIALTVTGVTARLALLWRQPTTGWVPVPGRALFAAGAVEALRSTQWRLVAAAELAGALDLPPADMAHLAASPALRLTSGPWLNAIPARSPATGTSAKALLPVLDAILAYRALHVAARAPDGLAPALAALRGADAAAPDPQLADFAALMGWDRAGTGALLDAFGLTAPDLADPTRAQRLHRAMMRAGAMGIAASDLLALISNDPDSTASARLGAALRARFAPSDWLDTMRPIADAMRARQRDALVAWCLHHFGQNPASAHIDNTEKLYEYLLMDVAMQPCMLTSRVRHALSSVQTFTERCLMGLEARVAPQVLDPAKWSWMKRYRVWEANRKVFLFPENWLDPRLRDDQSPLFTEAMSALLQGDITEDRAGQALTGFLTGLDQIAKLRISALYHEEREGQTPIIHVIARTDDSRRAWYYRRRAGMSWSPWTQIRLDIDDDPVLPVVWRDRLFLFWLKIVEEPQAASRPSPGNKTIAETPASSISASTRIPRHFVGAILNWSEYVGGEWQPVRSSDPTAPLYLTEADGTGTYRFNRRNLSMAALDWADGGLRISVKTNLYSSFFLYNSYSDPHQRIEKEAPHFHPRRTLETSGSGFGIRYGTSFERVLDQTIDADSAIGPNHMIAGGGETAGFFYQDARHAFYVDTQRSGFWMKETLVHVDTDTNPGWTMDLVESWADKLHYEIVDIPPKPGFGVTDPEPVAWKVKDDIGINQILATGGTVPFDGIQIGVAGSSVIRQKGQ